MSLRGESKRLVMRSHGEIDVRHFLPEESRGEVNGVEGAEFGGHRLRRAVEHQSVYLYQVKGRDQLQDYRATAGDVHIGETGAKP